LFFVLRSTADIGSPSNEFSFARVSTFEILDESGVSQTGFSPIDASSDMAMRYGHAYDNLFLINNNAHVWSFSQSSFKILNTDLVIDQCGLMVSAA
jgi:hypothetical protein